MAFFGKKKETEKSGADAAPATTANGAGDANGAPAGGGNGDGKFKPQPDKAARFFERARTVHETTNYEYAMQLWLGGLRFNPGDMNATEAFFRSAGSFVANAEGRSVSKDVSKEFGGRGDVERYLTALLAWGTQPASPVAAVVATEAGARLNLAEPTYWLGERAIGVVLRDKKPRKDLLIRLKEAFSTIGAFDKAVESGQAAMRLDPSDGELAAEIRNLSATATMTKGGYETAGQEGGFRANVRDAEGQRRLDESDRIVKSENVVERLLREAEVEYQQRQDDPAAINVYVKRLLERGKPEDEKRARTILNQAFEATKQFRFRQLSGDIKLRMAARKLEQYRLAAEAGPGDAKAQETHREARAQFLKMEIDEYKMRYDAYPTDLANQFALAKRYVQAERYDEAMPLLQAATSDSKNRVPAFGLLGQCFLRLGYTDEAVHSFRQGLDAHKVLTDETGMELRYGLLTALHAKAEADRDAAAAEEADKLAASIFVQQVGFRDIRQRRDTIKRLLQDLRRGA